jgi:hypothetical protein
MKIIITIIVLTTLCIGNPTENYEFNIDSLTKLIRTLQYGKTNTTYPNFK